MPPCRAVCDHEGGKIIRRPAFVAAVLLFVASAASSQTLDELHNDGKQTDHVLTYGMGYHQNRYSTLKQVNK